MAYDIKENELYVTRRGHFNEPRNVAVYPIRHLINDTLKHVGEDFGIEKYSTVSSIVERVKYGMKADKGLKNRIQHLANTITKSQRQTPPPHHIQGNTQDIKFMQRIVVRVLCAGRR